MTPRVRLPSFRPRRGGWRVLSLALALAGSGVGAQERPPAPAAAGSTSNTRVDTLDAARDELARIKAERGSALPAPGGLPRLSAPEWHGGPAPIRPVAPPRTVPNAAGEPRRSNWLVDAMQTPGRGADRDGAVETSEEATASGAGIPPLPRTVARPAESRDGGRRAGENPGSAPTGSSLTGTMAPNPLAPYLSDWMTPSDQALLQPQPFRLPGALPSAPGMSPLLGSLASATPAADGTTGFAPSPPAAAVARATPRENPFLAALGPPAGSKPAPTATAAPSPPSAPGAAPLLAQPAAPPPPSRVPEFARPANDEKYFKPLKRF